MPLRAAALLLLLVVWGCLPCEDYGAELGDACLPQAMASNTELEIEVREACGSSCSEPPDCAAKLELDEITVVVSQRMCQESCEPTSVCEYRATTCLLPALPPGDYMVNLPGLGRRPLHVQPGARASCFL